MLFRRTFASSRVAAAQFFAKTSVSPNGAFLRAPTHFTPKSVVLLSTPQNLPFVIENAITLHQIADMQVVVAGVDAVVPNGARSGISELWMDDYITFEHSVALTQKDSPPPLRESDGVHPVSAKTNWKQIDPVFRVKLGARRVDLDLANTAFSTNTLATLFYFLPKNLQNVASDPNMGETLCELTAVLPDLEPQLSEPVSHDRWTKLTDQDLVITECTGNLIKSINKSSAAAFLEQNEKLGAIASRDTKVYVKLYSGLDVHKYEVIAGGGGWGAKADLLAISPEAKPKPGDRIEFYMVTPSDRFGDMDLAVVSRKIQFECVPEAMSYNGSASQPQEIEDLFGCGCEGGFELDGVNYRSSGEAVEFSF